MKVDFVIDVALGIWLSSTWLTVSRTAPSTWTLKRAAGNRLAGFSVHEGEGNPMRKIAVAQTSNGMESDAALISSTAALIH
jgi:hypothetical protein